MARRWLVTIVLILLGCGAAGGTILVGSLGGDVSVDASSPLKFEEPSVEGLPEG